MPLQLDRCARLTVGRRRWGAYRVMGTVGALVGFTVVSTVAWTRGVDVVVWLIVVGVVPASFLVAVKLSYVFFGRERIVFYEKTLLALGAVAAALAALDEPVATGVDLATVGIGAFLVVGRIGCLMVGCCFGRPARRGIAYGDAHAAAGFPSWLVGRRLFPMQLVDACGSLVATTIAVCVDSSGAAAAAFLTVYGLGRFVEELFRGDSDRPLWRGATEAQWTAVAVAWGIVGVMGLNAWTVAPAVALSVGLVAVVARGRRLFDPWHVAELARALRTLRPGGASLTTTLGIRVSLAVLDTPSGPIRDYILSSNRPAFDREIVVRLVGAVGLRDAMVRPAATPGLFHVVQRPPQAV